MTDSKAAVKEAPVTKQDFEILMNRFDQLAKENAGLKQENQLLRNATLRPGQWPELKEVDRQKKELEKLNIPGSTGKYSYKIRIAPKGVKDDKKKQVIYKREMIFSCDEKPEILRSKTTGKKRLSRRTIELVVAKYNTGPTPARLNSENVVVEYVGPVSA